MIPARATIGDAVAVLADGPCDEDDLVEQLGLVREDDATWLFMEELEDDVRIVELADGRLALASALLDGVVAWHRVGEDEVAARTIAPGIDGIWHLAVGPWPHEVRIGAETVAFSVWSDDEGPDLDRGPALTLPEGWAVDLAAGDLVALVLDGHQTCLVAATDPRAVSASAGSGGHDGVDGGGRLRAAFSAVAEEHAEALTLLRDPDRSIGDQWILHLDEVATLLLADYGRVVGDLDQPLIEAVGGSGLVRSDGLIGGPGVSESQLGIYALGGTLLRARVDLDPVEGEVVEATGLAWDILAGAEHLPDANDPSVQSALLVALDVPEAVDVIVDRLRSIDDARLGALSEQAVRAHELDPGGPGPAWLAAETLVARGGAVEALDVLAGTIGGDRSVPVHEWRGPWETLANLRGVAGDIAAAIELYEQIGEIGAVRRLSQWRSTPPRGVGRNERCPCGSGRKFKQCCLVHPVPLDLDGRVPALWWKLETWVVRYHGDHVPRPDLDAFDDLEGLGPSMAAVWMLGYDAHLVEDGAMAEVVDEIGALLPADERALVDQWLLRARSLWEVVSVNATGRIRLRDLLQGEDLTVTAASLADAAVGDLLMAMVVPGATGEHLVGHVTHVPFAARDRALRVLAEDPDGQDIIDLVADLVGPPRMTTPDGDPLVVHEGHWQVADLGAAVAALDRTSPRTGDELEWPDGEEGESVRWSLRAEGDELVGTALSDPRWDELEEMVDQVVPDATLVDHQVTEGASLLAAARQAAEDPLSPLGDQPELGEDQEFGDGPEDDLVQQFVRQKEVEWCDEPVPALGGITPRQAVADPTRRADVVALLRSFRTPVTPTLAGRGFDADRLAALLDLAGEL